MKIIKQLFALTFCAICPVAGTHAMANAFQLIHDSNNNDLGKLLKEFPQTAIILSTQGHAPISYAFEVYNYDAVSILLSSPIIAQSFPLADQHRWTSLRWAVFRSELESPTDKTIGDKKKKEIFKQLANHPQAGPMFSIRDRDGFTPLRLALHYYFEKKLTSYMKMITALLESPHAHTSFLVVDGNGTSFLAPGGAGTGTSILGFLVQYRGTTFENAAKELRIQIYLSAHRFASRDLIAQLEADEELYLVDKLHKECRR